jgi:nicotinamidase-related amidase
MPSRHDLDDLHDQPLPRSPLMLHRQRSAVLVVDVQERLIPAIQASARLRWNIRRVLDCAQLWQIPRLGTEQNPARLGPTVPELAGQLEFVGAKLAFSAGNCVSLVHHLRSLQRDQVLVVGIETHVCVLQSVLDLMTEGYQVHIAADAVSTRCSVDHDWALRRMESCGATVTTTEMVMFEWCETAGTDEFRRTSAWVKETSPEPGSEGIGPC